MAGPQFSTKVGCFSYILELFQQDLSFLGNTPLKIKISLADFVFRLDPYVMLFQNIQEVC